MVLGAMIVGGMVGNYAARRQFESMQMAKAQQEQLNQAQAQAAQAQQAAQAAHAQVQATQAASQSKDDLFQQLEKIASLKQKGILTEEEFQKMKTKLLSSS